MDTRTRPYERTQSQGPCTRTLNWLFNEEYKRTLSKYTRKGNSY